MKQSKRFWISIVIIVAMVASIIINIDTIHVGIKVDNIVVVGGGTVCLVASWLILFDSIIIAIKVFKNNG